VHQPNKSEGTPLSSAPVGKATGVGIPTDRPPGRPALSHTYGHTQLTSERGVPSSRVASEQLVRAEENERSPIRAQQGLPADEVVGETVGEMVGEMVGIVGHELRNPLSAIAALAQVTMSRSDLPADVRQRLEQMDRAARRSLALVESLLDFSASRWRGVLSTRPVLSLPREIAGRVIDEMRAANPDRHIALEVRSLEPFEMDPARIEQVLCNLIANAITHGSADTPIEVSVDVREGEALLAVKNRGPVIPADRIASLFQPFTQGPENDVGGAGVARSRGMGLGLYIVREIVDAHGGTISVDSHGDRGTTFLVRLPRRRM
jgi:signal transduction histidine kinase